jgi:O-antigen ligase
MMQVFVVAGLVYSVPILYELRMSPMLHENVYGFLPRTDWSQNLRLGGYRPTVFMGHGLVVGFFMFLCTVAAVALHKAGRRKLWGNVPMSFVIAYMFLMLVLVKATAALLYAAAGFALIRFVSVKNQLRIYVVLALIVVSYPFSRITDIFPTKAILSAAGTFGADRVQSMEFRFDNEDILVLKGVERPIFGWGGFARERVYDAETGKDLVVQDGAWISLFGTHGTLGFACYYFILLAPIFATARRWRRVRDPVDRTLLTSLCFIVVVCAVNTLPNTSLPNLQFFFAAALATLLEELPKQAAQAAKAQQRAASEAAELAPATISGLPHVR